MAKHLFVAASLACALSTTSAAGAQSLSLAEVDAAVEQGYAGKTLQKKCGASGDNGFDIVIEGPMGVVMRAAREARGQRRDFTAVDVTAAQAGPWLTVRVLRDYSLRAPWGDVSSLAKGGPGEKYEADIVLRSRPDGRGEPVVLKPAGRILHTSANSKNALPNRVILPPMPGFNMAAVFDLAAFRAVPHKEIDVVVFASDAGERRCRISEKERQALR